MVVLRAEASPWMDRRRERKAKGDLTMSLGKVIGMLSAVLLVVAAAGIGCGGSDSSGNSNSGGDSGNGSSAKQASGPDEYATQVCDALGKYADDMDALFNGDTNLDDPAQQQEAASKMSTMFKGMANDLDKINPPSDVKDLHEGMVSALLSIADLSDQMNKALDKPLDEAMADIEDISAKMGDAGTPLNSMGDMPTDYQQAFENNDKCKELSILE